MTKRYSVQDVAQMLQTDHEQIRQTVSYLAERRLLSHETFLFAASTWRIAPSDVPLIQQRLKDRLPDHEAKPKRRHKVVRKVNETEP